MSKYSNLFPKKEPVVEYEIATGCFTCQEPGCWGIVYEAKYIEKINTLTWLCPNDPKHVSKIENFE